MKKILIIVLLSATILLNACVVVPGPIGVVGEYGAVTVQPNPVVVSSGYTGTYYNYTGRVQAVNITPYYSNPPIYYGERPVVRNYYAPQVYVPPPLSSTGVIINTGPTPPPFYRPPSH